MPGGLHGPVVFTYVDGYDVTAMKITSFSRKEIARQTRVDGIGDTWEEHKPTGKRALEVTQDGALWNTDVQQSHDAFRSDLPATPQIASRVVTVGFMGDTLSNLVDCIEGAFSNEYEILTSQEDLQRVNVAYVATGQLDKGVVLHPKAARTSSADSESTPHDGLAQSTSGGVAYMHVFNDSTSFTNFVGTVRDSSDDISYFDLVAFPDNVTVPYGARVAVSGTVERYLAFKWVLTGSGTLTIWAGFARNPAA